MRLNGLMGRVRILGLEGTGAKVEGVALGLRAFGVETAEGAALGLCALGLTDEAAALGLAAFGPVAAGAEPGVGMKTPCAIATPAQRSEAHAADMANKRLKVEVIAPSPRRPHGTGLELQRSEHDKVATNPPERLF